MGKNILFVKRIWIFLLITLVMSITPVSAVELCNEMNNSNAELVQDTNAVTQHGVNVKDNGNSILNYAYDVLDRTCYILENSWKWWKWGSIWDNICQIGMDFYYTNCKIDDTSDEGFGTASSSLNLLFTSVASLFVIKEYGKVLDQRIDSDLNMDNSNKISVALQNSTFKNNDTNSNVTQNITVPATIDIPVNKLQKGDVVVYKSQDKYNRFLEYINCDNQTVFLRGPYSKTITIDYNDFTGHYTGSAIEVDPKNPKFSSQLVNKFYVSEKNDLQNKLNVNQKETEDNTDTRDIYKTICIVSIVIFAVGVIGAIITYYCNKQYDNTASNLDLEAENAYNNDRMFDRGFGDYEADGEIFTAAAITATETAKSSKLAFFAFVVTGVIGAAGITVGGIGWSDSNDNLGKLNNDAVILADNLADLNSWAVTENLTVPVVGSLNLTTHEGSSVEASFNGTDVYDDPLSYNVVSQPMNGTVTMNGVDGLVYKSNSGFVGNDTFSYRAKDDIWSIFSDAANITVNVNPDQAPIANNMSLFTATNRALNGVLDVRDPDNDTMICSMVTGPLYGSLDLNEEGSFVYTPFDNFTGEDSFSFKANDTVLDSNIGNVTIHVVNNTSPVAFNMVFNLGQNSILNSKFNVLGINGTEQLFNMISKPSHGILNIFGGDFSYKPVKNYNGQDIFTYKFTDVLNQTSNLATVKIFIRSPPTAESFKLSTGMNTKIQSTFKIKGYNSTSQVISKPKHGTLTILANDKFSYQPNNGYTGKDTFTYQSIDKLGQKSQVANIVITVTKPKPHPIKQPKMGDITSFNKALPTMNSLILNSPHLESFNLDINKLNSTLNMGSLNLTNIKPENPTQLITDQLTNFFNKIINIIKTTMNNIKL
jgi:hypothetical protein